MNETRTSGSEHYPQLDALRGIAAVTVVINHFVLIGPLWWITKSPLRVIGLGHEAVILFFLQSGFVLTLQLTSVRRIRYRDYLIKRVCRIYLPYLAVLVATLWIVGELDVRPVNWAGVWFSGLWAGHFTNLEILNHIVFIGQYEAGHIIPVVWSLIYEIRISLLMPLVAYCVARVPVYYCIAAAMIISIVSFVLVLAEGANASSANFNSDWAMTAHYLGIFIVGATLAIHRAGWRQWLAREGHTGAVLVVSLGLYFLSRSVMSLASGAIGQFIFDWSVAAGASGIICTALVSKRFASALAKRPIVFLGTISYSLYLTHTVVLLAVIHLMSSPDSAWRAIITAAVLVIPVATLTHFIVERPAIVFGKFLTRRGAAFALRVKQAS